MTDPTDIDAEAAEAALRTYVHRVAAALGVGPESTWTELADRPGAYIALGDRLPRQPAGDVALTWDGISGWALGVEIGGGEELLVLDRYGPDVVPDPDDVVAFTKSVLAGESPGQPAAARPPLPGNGDTVRARLRAYLPAVR